MCNYIYELEERDQLCCLRSTFQSKPFYADPRESVHINENSIVNDDV